MNSFKSSEIKLNSESVSDILKRTRYDKKLKIEKISHDLNISAKYLNALEAGNFSILPDGIYGKNFLRDYSLYLGLDTKEILSLYEENEVVKPRLKTEDLFSKKIPKPHYFLSLPKIIKNFLIVAMVFLCILYISFYVKNIISPPPLEITSPTDNFTTSSSYVTILGNTDKKASITINNENILIDSLGNFSKTINLKQGVNTITILAQKKYSKINKIDKIVLVK
jgi:cytoskeletal protein RodZ